jgi:hypothetical protein
MFDNLHLNFKNTIFAIKQLTKNKYYENQFLRSCYLYGGN